MSLAQRTQCDVDDRSDLRALRMSDGLAIRLLAIGMTAFYAAPVAALYGFGSAMAVAALVALMVWVFVTRRSARAYGSGSRPTAPLAWLLASTVPSVIALVAGREAIGWVVLAVPFVVLVGVMTLTIVPSGGVAAKAAFGITASFVIVWVALSLIWIEGSAGEQLLNGLLAGTLLAFVLLTLTEIRPR